jgi:hypothetical protein
MSLSSSLSKLEELSLLEPELLACRVSVVVYSELMKLLSHRTALLGTRLNFFQSDVRRAVCWRLKEFDKIVDTHFDAACI